MSWFPRWLSILVLLGVIGRGLAEEPRLELVLQTGHTDVVSSVALTGDGMHLVTGSWDSSAILWETATGKKIQTFQGHSDQINSIALSSDGKTLVTVSGGGAC